MAENKGKGAEALPKKDEQQNEGAQESGTGITVSGISGTKMLRVGRVNKKAKEKPEDSPQKAEEPVTVPVEKIEEAPVEKKKAPKAAPTEKVSEKVSVPEPKAVEVKEPSESPKKKEIVKEEAAPAAPVKEEKATVEIGRASCRERV